MNYISELYSIPVRNTSTILLPRLCKVLLLFFMIGFTSCSTSKRVFTKIDKEFEASKEFRGGFTGLAVYDPQNDKFIYEYQSHKYFTPASTIKLFTFYTGLKLLEDSVPGIRYTVRQDSLIFQGTGDPSLLHPELPGSPVPVFLQNRKESLYYLPSKKTVPPFGPGWAWDDYSYSFSAERSVFPIYGNLVTFNFSPFRAPSVIPREFAESIITDRSKSGGQRRAPHANLFHLPGTKMIGDRQIPFRTSEQLAVKLLADTLGREVSFLPEDFDMELPLQVRSVATDSLYKRMLQESDNLIAEQILLLAAGLHTDTLSPRTAIRIMKETHLNDLPDPLKWVDGSGLSRYNLTTPRTVIRLLEKIEEELPYSRLFSLFPAGGTSGTLKDQFKSASPYIYGKTGSMSNQYSLSGYLITRKGKVLLFSFMNSNYMAPPSALKLKMEEILTAIRNEY